MYCTFFFCAYIDLCTDLQIIYTLSNCHYLIFAVTSEEFKLTLTEIGLDICDLEAQSLPHVKESHRTQYESSAIEEGDFLLLFRKKEGMMYVAIAHEPIDGAYVKVKLYEPVHVDTRKMMQDPHFVEVNKTKRGVQVQHRYIYARFKAHNTKDGKKMPKKRETIHLTDRALELYRKFYRQIFKREYPGASWKKWDVFQRNK